MDALPSFGHPVPDYPMICPKCDSPRYDTTPGYGGRVYACGSGWFEGDGEFVQMAACPIISTLRDDLAGAIEHQRVLDQEVSEFRFRAGTAESALSLIASPMRPDGTWNRDRAVCQQLAEDVLEKIRRG